MKDEQLRILSDQNSQLLVNLDKVEEDANNIQMEKLAVEEENRSLRDVNFELQSKARAADSQLKKAQAENADKDKQLKIMTDQNAELLRLLETEEAQTAKISSENEAFRKELEALRGKYGALLTTAKTHEEMAARAAREGQLRAEEVRILRAECEQLKNNNAELKMKTQVELEALQEQVRPPPSLDRPASGEWTVESGPAIKPCRGWRRPMHPPPRLLAARCRQIEGLLPLGPDTPIHALLLPPLPAAGAQGEAVPAAGKAAGPGGGQAAGRGSGGRHGG